MTHHQRLERHLGRLPVARDELLQQLLVCQVPGRPHVEKRADVPEVRGLPTIRHVPGPRSIPVVFK